MSSEQAEAAQGPKHGSVGEFLVVALPLMVSYGSLSLQFVIDRLFLTWESTQALAAVMPSSMLYWTVISLPMGVVTYVSTFVAQYSGSGQKERVGASMWHGVYLAVVAGLLLLPIAAGSRHFFAWIGHSEHLQPLEATYFSTMMMGAVWMLINAALSSFYIGLGRSWVVLWGNLLQTALNILFDYLLIFGKLGLPAMGMGGAALATVLAGAGGTVFYVVWMLSSSGFREYQLRLRPLDRPLMARMMKFGLPNGMHQFLEVICFTIFVQMVGWESENSNDMAATSLAFALNTLTFAPMIGASMAVSTLVGQRLGANQADAAARTTWTAFKLTAVYIGGFCCIYLFMPDLILLPYASNSSPAEFAALRERVIVLLRFVALYSIFDAMNMIFGSAIRGAGDTRFAMLFATSNGVLLLVLPTFAYYHLWGPNLLVAWSCMTLYLVVVGTGFCLRFLGGHWKTLRVIETPVDELATSQDTV